jgi:hypothetical protein
VGGLRGTNGFSPPVVSPELRLSPLRGRRAGCVAYQRHAICEVEAGRTGEWRGGTLSPRPLREDDANRRLWAELLAEVILQTDLLDEAELLFQKIDVAFLIRQDALQKIG